MMSLIGIGDIAKLLGVQKRSAYLIVARPDFPPARQLSPRLRRWPACEVEAWFMKLPVAVGREPAQLQRARYKRNSERN